MMTNSSSLSALSRALQQVNAMGMALQHCAYTLFRCAVLYWEAALLGWFLYHSCLGPTVVELFDQTWHYITWAATFVQTQHADVDVASNVTFCAGAATVMGFWILHESVDWSKKHRIASKQQQQGHAVCPSCGHCFVNTRLQHGQAQSAVVSVPVSDPQQAEIVKPKVQSQLSWQDDDEEAKQENPSKEDETVVDSTPSSNTNTTMETRDKSNNSVETQSSSSSSCLMAASQNSTTTAAATTAPVTSSRRSSASSSSTSSLHRVQQLVTVSEDEDEDDTTDTSPDFDIPPRRSSLRSLRDEEGSCSSYRSSSVRSVSFDFDTPATCPSLMERSPHYRAVHDDDDYDDDDDEAYEDELIAFAASTISNLTSNTFATSASDKDWPKTKRSVGAGSGGTSPMAATKKTTTISSSLPASNIPLKQGGVLPSQEHKSSGKDETSNKQHNDDDHAGELDEDLYVEESTNNDDKDEGGKDEKDRDRANSMDYYYGYVADPSSSVDYGYGQDEADNAGTDKYTDDYYGYVDDEAPSDYYGYGD